MLATVTADPARSLGLMPPLWRECTLGEARGQRGDGGLRARVLPRGRSRPREALLDPAFNLYGVQATTHPVAPLLVAERTPGASGSGMHSGSGLFGPGFRANATIGRAIRLVLMNVGGGWPGRHDMATQGSPAKFSFAVGGGGRRQPVGRRCT